MVLDIPLLPSLLDFQAGGGGGFGGGGGGGGGGGDADGIFWILYWLIRLALVYPVVGVPLLVVFVVVAAVGTRKGWWKHQEHVIRRYEPRRRARSSALAADVLRASDPAFDERRFLERVRAAFGKAQASWCAQDLEPLRAFVTDGVFERFSLQVEEQKQDGWRQELKGLQAGAPSILQVEAGAHFDTLTVRVPFRAEVLRVDAESGKERRGTRLPRTTFSECWSFVRRRGAKSVSGAGLMEGQCPNCGATLSINQSARCGHCECLVRSGQFDWVLAEITQESEWRPSSERDLPGLSALLERDPGFSVQMLEDRASVAFWRKVAADRAGSADPLARVADEELCRRYAEGLAAPQDGPRGFQADCAVGSVATLGVLADEGDDRVVVEVVWDGRRARLGPDGRLVLDRQRRLARTLFVFRRRAGARTKLEEAFTTATCRTCGAHDVGGTRPDCPWCGAPRAGDATTWLLAEIVDRGERRARDLLDRLAWTPRRPRAAGERPESAAGLLAWAAALVRADGDVDERERAAVLRLAERLRLSEERVDELLYMGGEGSGPEPDDPDEARAWFRALAELALADGGLDRRERGFLAHAADRLGLGRRAADEALQAARSKLYRDSREARGWAPLAPP